MHARSTTIHARPSEVDEGIRYVRDEVMPAITAMEGCMGLSMLVDRASGRCIATSAWTDEASMRAADAALRPMRERAGMILGGQVQVDEWEIAMLHRDHRTSDSTHVRCAWIRTAPERMDELVDIFRSEALPRLEAMDGFCSASFMVDRRAGRAVSSATWDTDMALMGSRDSSAALRSHLLSRVGAEVEDVGEFQMALAHLRVPELV